MSWWKSTTACCSPKSALIVALAAALTVPAFAAPEPGSLAHRIAEAKKAGSDFFAVNLFAEGENLGRAATKDGRHTKAAEVLSDGMVLKLHPGALRAMQIDQPESITLTLPYDRAEKGELVVELVKVNIFADGFKVVTSSPERNTDYDLGVHYRGIVRGDDDTMVAVSFSRGEVMGLIHGENVGELVLGRFEGEGPSGDHVLYNRTNLKGLEGASCFTDDKAGEVDPFAQRVEKTARAVAPVKIERGVAMGTKAAGDCVELYYETDYNIYQNKGSTSAVTSFVTGIHNQVAAIYSGESITTGISEIFVWNNSGDPYTSSSASTTLSQFQNYRTSWNGDLAQVLKLSSGVSGIAAGFSGICNSNRSESMSASNILSSYSTVPTYSDTVFVVAHEFGHTFGSRHTHACVWNGNNTAIDSCSGFTEGSCPLPGWPSGGGTIMSYCPQVSVGVNFNNGFGTQPGNVIRGDVAAGSCLSSTCGGGGGGGGGGGNCHVGAIGTANYCSTSCPCDDGEGDCDSNAECTSGTTCVSNVGPNYGWASWVDVCEGGGSNPNSCAGNCGSQAPGGCWCDSLCAQYGDCCSDKVQQCG